MIIHSDEDGFIQASQLPANTKQCWHQTIQIGDFRRLLETWHINSPSLFHLDDDEDEDEEVVDLY
jgi:hypothetical protein